MYLNIQVLLQSSGYALVVHAAVNIHVNKIVSRVGEVRTKLLKEALNVQ
jgi:hypothetical protein